MTEFYNEHDCDCHAHPHKDPIEDLQMFVANYYTSLLTKLRNHINDTSAGHVTAEEKDYWNNKADKIALRDLEEMLVSLKNKVGNIQDTIEDDLKQWVKKKKYVTEDEMISYVAQQINKIVAGQVDLAGYAKESWVLDKINSMIKPGGELDLSKYALKTDLDSLIARLASLEVKVNNIENKVTNIENGGGGKNYEITNVTVTGQTLTITQNNMGSKSVTLPSGGGSTISGVSRSEVESMLSNAKTLIVTKNGESYKSYNPFNSQSDITIDLVSGGGTGGDSSTNRYQAFFQNTNKYDVAPAIPETGKGPTDYASTDERSKWETNAKNPLKGYYTWMTFAYLSNGVYGSWTTPVRITGKDGEAGTDTTDKEQIYKTAGEGENVEKPNNDPNTNDYVPAGWTDNPQGVSSTIPCEWTCIRTKNTETNKWSDWTEPVLWAHYGHNGTDGDGVEYIFWAGHNPQDYPSSEPNSWYTDEQSKNNEYDSNGSYSEEESSDEYYNTKYYNKREYIKKNSGWQDDPIDLSKSSYGPGSVQYVSIRKKRDDSDSNSSESKDAYWHQYSEPALWSYYAQDGDAGKGVSLNLDNGTMAVALNSNGYNQLFDQDCVVRFYNGTSTVKIDTIDCSVYDASGNSVSTDGSFYISTTDDSNDPNCKNIRVHIENDKLNFNDGGYTIKVSARANITGEGTTRYATIQLIGVNFGEDGVSYRLGLSSSVVKISRGSRYPGEIEVNLIKTKGSDVMQSTPVSQVISTDNRWSFKYSVDSKSEQTLTSDTLSQTLINSAENTIRVELDFNGTLVDTQTVVFVQDGIQGQNGISYSVDVQSDDVIGTYSGDNITYSGTVKFYVTKLGSTLDNSTGEYKPSQSYLTSDNVTVKAYLGSVLSDEATVSYDTTTNLWTATVSGTSKAFVLVNVSEKSSGMFYTSAVVPFITPGKDGSASAPQTLIGSPLRMLGTWQEGKEYLDGTIAASDGVKYQDIVLYSNQYYVCVNHDEIAKLPNKWNTTPPSTSYWQKMSVTEDFVADKLAANQAYIKELSSEEVVITDNNKIVAGMTSSSSLKNSILPSNITKGDIRIWAGEVTSGNLADAAFTVSNNGVVTSRGQNNSISINNGTIWFYVDGKTYRLGITGGKPDWIQEGATRPVNFSCYTFNDKGNGYVGLSNVILSHDTTNDIYYSDYNNSTKASGDYYVEANPQGVNDGGYVIQGEFNNFVNHNVNGYRKVSFSNGIKADQDYYVLIGNTYTENSSGTVDINPTTYQYFKAGTTTPILLSSLKNMNGEIEWGSYDYEDSNSRLTTVAKSAKIISYTNSQAAGTYVGLNDDETAIVKKQFPQAASSRSKAASIFNWDEI